MGGAWVLLALVALVMTCAYSVSMKWLLTDAEESDPVLVSAVVFTLVGGAATGLWALAGAPATDLTALRSPETLRLVALDVALYTLGPIWYYRALRVLPVGQVAILHASVGVFALVGGALLGTEAVTVARCAGAGLIVVGVFLVHARGEGAASRSALTLVGACALFAAGAMVDQRLVQGSGLSAPLVVGVAYLLPGLALMVGSLARAEGPGAVLVRVLRRRPVYANAAVLAATYLCIYGAYGEGGPASGVTLILAAEAVLVVLVAAAVLGERDQLSRKVLAGLIVAAGVGLVG